MELLLRAQVEDLMAIEQRQVVGQSLVFGGRLRVSPGLAVDRLRERLRPYGYTPFLREERGLAWVQNQGEGLPYAQGTPLTVHLPPDALRVLIDGTAVGESVAVGGGQ